MEPKTPDSRWGADVDELLRSTTDQALDYLNNDREFLTRGGVFSNEMIDAYIELKMEEVTRFRMTTHPLEYEMYYSI